jgi:hypothetical protein
VLQRLLVQPLARLEDVAAGRPGVSGGPRHVALAGVARRGAAVARGELQLGRGLLVEVRGRVERIRVGAQFQTLTSR